MKKLCFIAVFAFATTLSFANNNTALNKKSFYIPTVVEKGYQLNEKEINRTQLKKQGNTNEEFTCTVSGTITYGKLSINVSVTAETCKEAGAGYVEAAVGAYKELRRILK